MSELGNRVRAARAYAGSMTQEDLAAKLPFSLSTLQRTEAGGRVLRPLEEPAFVEAVADATKLPPWFFTVDLHHEPPEDRLASLEETVREMMATLERLGEQAEWQLGHGKEQLEEFGRILETAKKGKP